MKHHHGHAHDHGWGSVVKILLCIAGMVALAAILYWIG